MCGLDVGCPCCKKGILYNDRTNFSKNKLLFPIFGVDGPPMWAMVMSMKCPTCKYRVNANSGETLCNLPAYARDAYPVETKCAFDNKNSHLGSSATCVFDLLMTTYGNGDLCSRLLHHRVNRSHVQRVENYCSFNIKKEKNLMEKKFCLMSRRMEATLRHTLHLVTRHGTCVTKPAQANLHRGGLVIMTDTHVKHRGLPVP